ncbi:MAG: hypothetical protein U0230_20605 [Polyangiales bacterium]
MRHLRVGRLRVRILPGNPIQGTEPIDAFVVPDDSLLTHTGGDIPGLWDASRSDLEEFAETRIARPLAIGDVVITPPFGLPAKHLLLAITFDVDGYRSIGPVEVELLFGRLLDEAGSLQCNSISVPLLGADLGRLDWHGSLAAVCAAIDERSCDSLAPTAIDVWVASEHHQEAERLARERLQERAPIGELVSRVCGALPPPEAAALRGAFDAVAAQQSDDAFLELFRLAESAHHALSVADPSTATAHRSPIADRILRDANATRTRLASRVPIPANEQAKMLRLLARAAEQLLIECAAGTPEVREAGTPSGQAPPGATVTGLVRPPTASDAALMVAGAAGAAALGMPMALALPGAALGLPLWGMLAKRLAPRTVDAQRPADTMPAHVAREYASAETVVGGIAAEAQVTYGTPPLPPSPASTQVEPTRRPTVRSTVKRAVATRSSYHPTSEPVRRLHALLIDRLSPAAAADLYQLLEDEGYQGDPELRLLEHCVRVEDPGDLVASLFSASELRRILDAEGVPRDPRNTDRQLALRLLSHFGFPDSSPPHGLHQARGFFREALRDVAHADRERLGGLVTTAASRLEYLLIVLLRFLCSAAYGQSPEAYFAGSGELERGRRIDQCSLGTLFSLAARLGRDLERDPAESKKVFRRTVSEFRLVPEDAPRMAAWRNGFAHVARSTEGESLSASRSRAQTFMEAGLDFIDYLESEPSRVFPRVIRIEQIAIDGWGRRTIRAITDSGEKEHLFTDLDLAPGEIYFMHPFSNPLRVDPVLVPAGDTSRIIDSSVARRDAAGKT